MKVILVMSVLLIMCIKHHLPTATKVRNSPASLHNMYTSIQIQFMHTGIACFEIWGLMPPMWSPCHLHAHLPCVHVTALPK